MPIHRNHQLWLGIVSLTFAICFAYWPAINGRFILDDDLLVTRNNLIKAPDGLLRFWTSTEPTDYWPVTNSAFWFEWRLFAENPVGYHIVNLFLHWACCLFLWAILRKLAIPGAYFAAMLFAVHPVNVETVAWIAQQKSLWAMLFALLSTRCHLSARASESPIKSHWYWISLITFVAAMLSKGSVAVLPLLLLLIVWWQQRRITFNNAVELIPYFLVSAILTAVNIWFQTHGSAEVVRAQVLIHDCSLQEPCHGFISRKHCHRSACCSFIPSGMWNQNESCGGSPLPQHY
jgi:protein O-mannosyl-transferase